MRRRARHPTTLRPRTRAGPWPRRFRGSFAGGRWAGDRVTASIRPERIRLVPGGPDIARSATYSGSGMEFAVRTCGIAWLVSRAIHEHRFTEGATVRVDVDPADDFRAI